MPLPPSRATRQITLLLLGACALPGHAAGLGSIQVNSSLGQPLRATIPLVGTDTQEHGSHCIKAKVASLDGMLVLTPQIALSRSAQSASIKLSTRQSVNEPALNVFVDMGCDTPIRREYQILLDLPLDSPVLPPAAQTAQASLPASMPATPRRTDRVRPAPQGEVNPPQKAAKQPRLQKEPVNITAMPAAAMRTEEQLAAPANAEKTRAKERPAPQAADKKPVRSVLRMSAPDIALPDPGETLTLKLKFADTLSMALEETDPQKRARLYAEQERLGALLRNEDLVETTRDQLKKVQAELGALRSETERLRQQNRLGQEAMESARAESMLWLQLLAGALVIFAAALALLIWQMRRMKQASSSWKQVANDFADADDTDTLAGTTAFGISEFNTTELDADFNTTQFDRSAFDIDDPDATVPGRPLPPATASASPIQAAKAGERSATGMPQAQPAQAARKPAEKPASSDESVYSTTSMTPYVFLHRAEKANPAPEAALKAEEISDVMELAEAWMALQDPLKVKELLEPFSEVERPDSPLPWLCLLDVYRAMGDRGKYEAILQRIARLFNVNLSPWDVDAHAEPPKTLPDYPHVVQKILELWPTDDLLPYLQGLIEDNRDGTRKGFDLPVYRDILRLATLASEPNRPRQHEQIMHDSAYAILFAAPSVKPELAPEQEIDDDATQPVDTIAPAPSAAKPQIRTRPKFITPSYERAVTRKDNPETTPAQVRESKGKSAEPVMTAATSDGLALVDIELEAPVSVADENRRVARAVNSTLAGKATALREPLALAAAPATNDDMSPMSIKLHLAIAYQDIGDNEGACLLLEEVIKDGTREQSEQAQKMLDRLI